MSGSQYWKRWCSHATGIVLIATAHSFALAQDATPLVARPAAPRLPFLQSSNAAYESAAEAPMGAPAEAPMAAPAPPTVAPLPPPQYAAEAEVAPEEDCSFWGRRRARRAERKRRAQARWLGYPEEFEEIPLGTLLSAHTSTQVANGIAAQMVLYHYDFVDGSNRLNQKGLDRLAKIAGHLPDTFYPVIIERTPEDRELDEARRLVVLRELDSCPFPIPEERVVIGLPPAAGLRGVEARIINDRLMIQTQQGGFQGLSNGGFGSGINDAGSSAASGQFGP